MATKIKRSGKKVAAKKSATKAAKSTSTRRSTEDIDALVPDIVAALQSGAKMNEVKERFGFSHGQPIRQALARNGYDSKGNSLSVTKITGSGKALADKVAKRRESGDSWYLLAQATGKTETELRALLEEHGHAALASGRTYRPAAEKPKPAAKKVASSAKKGGRKVTRKAAADPSNQA